MALQTRDNILDAAQTLILDHGFGATTVDAVVARAGITKGAFFHHFPSKAGLARALVERYADAEREHFRLNKARASNLASDPLQRLLVLIGLFAEEFDALDTPYPGCLFASYVYENKLFDAGTLDVLRASALFWRQEMRAMLDDVVATRAPGKAVDLESLADLLYSILQGAFVMTKMLGDKSLLARQARHLRDYIELVFTPPQPSRS